LASVGLVIVTTGGGPVTGPNTLNPFASTACSLPVCTVTVRRPGVAVPLTVSCAEAAKGEVTVTGPNPPTGPPPTEIPGPKLACVTPGAKFVNEPPMLTGT